MNINYGKLVDGVIQYAPDYIDTKLGRITHPTDINYKFYGWKKIVRYPGYILGWYEVGVEIRSINQNINYGKLVDGVIQYAPDVMFIDNSWVEPSESQYTEFGFKRIIDSVNEGSISRIIEKDFIYVVRYANTHAKLVDGELFYAENFIITNESVNLNPTDEDYLSIGFKRFSYVPYPESIDGYDWIPDGYEETDSEIYNKYKSVPIPVPKPEPRVFSKMYLELAIFNSRVPGLLRKVDEFIDSIELENESGDKISLRRLYDKALTFSEDNQYFSTYLNRLKEYIPELTDELIEGILNNSIAR